MGRVTYPNPEVQDYIGRFFSSVQYNIVEQPEVMDRFNAVWTPTIIIEDMDGREHRRASGYLDPKRFLGELALGRMQAAIDRHQFQDAEKMADEVRNLTAGDPDREPEALYWSSVAAYKASNQAEKLTQGWNVLLDRFPQSEWARRAEFIRQAR